MIFEYGSPEIFAVCVLLLFANGMITLIFGRKFPEYCRWVTSFFLVVLLSAVGFALAKRLNSGGEVETWIRGWVLPHDERGAITVGILLDFPALLMSAAAILTAIFVLLNKALLIRQQRQERFTASIALGIAGVVLCWSAMTPWLVLVGILISVFAGFIALGSRWDSEEAAVSAVRFAWEKLWGLVLSWVGLCILAGGRAPLVWTTAGALGGGTGVADSLGAALLIGGIFVQIQSFPFMGGLLRTSEISPLFRVLLNQVIPAWGALALVVRMEPDLRGLGVFSLFGWVALGSAFLTIVAGLLESVGRQSLGLWVAAGFSFGFSIIAVAGTQAGLAVFIGVGLGAVAVASAVSAFDFRGNKNVTNLRKLTWTKVAGAFGVAAGLGMVGFVGAGGIAQGFAQTWDNGALVACLALVYLLLSTQGWKLAWIALKIKGPLDAPWYAVLVPYVFVLLSFGLLWTGTITGGLVPGDSDRVLGSLFELIGSGAGSGGFSAKGPGMAVPQLLLYAGTSLVALILSFWVGGRATDGWLQLKKALPRFSGFVAEGYGIELAGSRVVAGIRWFGLTLEEFRRRLFSDNPVLSFVAKSLKRSIAALAGIDSKLSSGLHALADRAVDIPARSLQYIQTGDLQLYLLMALGSGIAILAYFFRT